MKAIRVKWQGPTQRLPGRWVARDCDHNRVVVTRGELDAYDREVRNLCGPGSKAPSGEEMAAHKLCRKMVWTGRLHGGALGAGEYVFVFENLDPLKVS